MATCPSPGLFAIPWALEPLDGKTYLKYLAPAQLAYFSTAVLVTLPGTRPLRLALLPLWLWCCYRVATNVDVPDESGLGLMTAVATISMRVLGWTMEPKQFIRIGKYGPGGRARSISEILVDAGELCCNFRGIGWNWSVHKAPPPTKTPSNKEFLWTCLKDYIFYSLCFEATLVMYDSLFRYPELLAIPHPHLQHAAEALIYPLTTFAHMSAYHVFYTLTGVYVFGQEPSSWPQFFDAPWRATSLSEFWGKRWHQGLRDLFANAGGRPLSFVFGRIGYVFGTFLMSGFFHDMGYWGLMRRRGLCCSLTVYFVANGVGVILEGVYRSVTGRKVGGAVGWVWMMMWLVGWLMLSMTTECLDDLYGVLHVNVAARPVYGLYMGVKAILAMVR